MTKLHRDKRTGDYYTKDREYMIDKGCTGWNVYERDHRFKEEIYRYSFSVETLKEARESI